MKRKSFLINKAFHKYLWASIMTVAATQIANLIDASLVGNIIGSEGLAAVVISMPVLQAIYAISCLYVTSCTVIAGMAIGNGDSVKANSLFSISLCISVVFGLIIMIGGALSIESLMDFFCKSEELRPLAKPFMLVTLLSALPMLLMITLHQFVEVDGSPKLVTRAVIVGNIANVGMDIVFMKFLGMGIAGAAWATCIMYVVCCLMVLPHFRNKNTLRVCLAKLKEHIDVKQIFTIGIPLFLSTVLISVQFTCYNNIALTYMGKYGLMAIAVCIQLLTFSMVILTGTLRTIQPIGSILKGIGDSKGMMMLMSKAYKFMGIGLVLYTLVQFIFPIQIACLLGVRDEGAISTILVAIPAFSLNIVMQALLYNLIPVYQFYGHHRLALFISVGQTLLPVVGFWVMAVLGSSDKCPLPLSASWFGIFIGQLLTGLVIVISTMIIRRRHNLTPIFLIPRTEYSSLEFSYGYSREALHDSFNDMSSWLKQQNLDDGVVFKVRIIAEELMSNITRHSEQKDSNAYADVRLVVHPKYITFSLTDDGIPFNPIENKDKGYGLMIANNAASEINYKYQFGQNMTTVRVDRP